MDYKQIIYYGAPGTGKSFNVEKQLEGIIEKNKIRITIHPEYTYSDFVGQLLPESHSGKVEFNFKKGPFIRALRRAYGDSSENIYLVIEELSRGNVAAIFGDIFQLLDRNKRFVSMYPITNKDIADKIKEGQVTNIKDDKIVLPSNFNIICTVNTNDQSVFPMDTAFKRRFEWEYVSTHPAKNKNGDTDFKLNNPNIIIDEDGGNIFEMSWLEFYTSLNNFITDKDSGLGRNEDKQVGQFFLDFKKEKDLIANSHLKNKNKANKSKEFINTMIKNKLLMYLWQDVQGSSSFDENSLFDSSINSFDDLYRSYGKQQVFSKKLIEKFHESKGHYPY